MMPAARTYAPTVRHARRVLLFVAACLACAAAPGALAQDVPAPTTAQDSARVTGAYGQITKTETSAAPYFYFTERGAPTVRVELWGAVGAPGLYDIRAGTDLRTLLSLAGGPSFADLGLSKQRLDVIIVRGPDDARVPMEIFDATEIPYGQNPLLRNGDTVYLRSSTKRRFTLRDGITLAASIIGILLTVDRLILEK